jgi:hypothetical protein
MTESKIRAAPFTGRQTSWLVGPLNKKDFLFYFYLTLCYKKASYYYFKKWKKIICEKKISL